MSSTTSPTPQRFLVTGGAGFIGYHLSKALLERGHAVMSLDNMNAYYDTTLKHARLENLHQYPSHSIRTGDIANKEQIEAAFESHRPNIVVNLAAQAGVRYSIQNPDAYVQSNLVGFANILEACRNYGVDHLLYASSSSVYGGNIKVPFEETDPVDHPVSLYAATKRSNELLADSYAHLYNIPATGLRFFTVYGPFGRPDMAYYKFTRKFFNNETVTLFNGGDTLNDLSRDFTYIDDAIESLLRLIPLAPSGPLPHDIYNIGGSTPVTLTTFVSILEQALSDSLDEPVSFRKKYLTAQPGDVHATYASATKLNSAIGYAPTTDLRVGLQKFADWYVNYTSVANE